MPMWRHDREITTRLRPAEIAPIRSLATIFSIHPSSVKRTIYRVYKSKHSSLK